MTCQRNEHFSLERGRQDPGTLGHSQAWGQKKGGELSWLVEAAGREGQGGTGDQRCQVLNLRRGALAKTFW